MIDAYFEAEDLRSLSLKEKLAHCVLSNGLAEKIKKQKDRKIQNQSGNQQNQNGERSKKRRRKVKKSYY